MNKIILINVQNKILYYTYNLHYNCKYKIKTKLFYYTKSFKVQKDKHPKVKTIKKNINKQNSIAKEKIKIKILDGRRKCTCTRHIQF